MLEQEKSSVKYRIKSFSYDQSIDRRLLFTIEEIGVAGELRQYASEIIANFSWRKEFSIIDAALIMHAASDVLGVVDLTVAQGLLNSERQTNLI